MNTNGAVAIPQVENLANKRFVMAAMEAVAQSDAGSVANALNNACHEGFEWRGPHPLNEMNGVNAVAETVWQPLLASFSDLERRDEIVVGGRYVDRFGKTRDHVACMGGFMGTFKQNWLGIPATGQPILIRYGEVHEMRDGKIIQSNCLWDVLDVIRQAGFWPLAPSWGTEGLWRGPITGDGLVLTEQDMDEGLASIAQTLAMHRTLGAYNDHEMKGREGLLTMPQREHWHEKMMWYGPAGIGTARGLEGFVDFHQLPFRLTWPGRTGGQSIIDSGSAPHGGHYVQMGDGPYSVTAGWPSVIATHTGTGGVFGCGPTNRPVEMRVMDFYLHHEGKIRENWVPLDVIHVLLQQGVDVMARVRDQFGRNRLGLRS
ncbi:MAG: ester cyclase [Pseudomonadota bacterium]